MRPHWRFRQPFAGVIEVCRVHGDGRREPLGSIPFDHRTLRIRLPHGDEHRGEVWQIESRIPGCYRPATMVTVGPADETITLHLVE